MEIYYVFKKKKKQKLYCHGDKIKINDNFEKPYTEL